PVVIDIGAHIGDTACLIKSLKSDARVFSFEPNPKTYKQLSRTAKKYGFTSYNLGVGDKPGKLTLYDSLSGSSPFASFYPGAINLHGREMTKYTVSLTTMDIFHTKNIPGKSIDLLKIDVEGHELAVFKGSQQIIKRKLVKAVLFEFNSMNIQSRTFFADYVKLMKNYDLYRLLPKGMIALSDTSILQNEIFAYQNIVAIIKHL
ncbi:MAG: FkbM family methyltransferase, partial [Candidatus Magasanikbacteria bacterium]|nr:FkbM family methyltransferase [Candidatus Magasanikbacteria bacterium]